MIVDILKGTNNEQGILVTDRKLQLTKDDINNTITIKETGRDAKLKKVTLSDFPDKTVGIKMDAYGKNICNFFNSSKKFINKGCDALLFTELTGSLYEGTDKFNKKYIFIIDLKSKDTKGFELQMMSTKAFVDYLKSVINEFFPDNDFDEFDLIFVLFSSKKRYKSYTRRRYERYGQMRRKNNIDYLDCNAWGTKRVFNLKKIIDEYSV